MLLCMLFRSKGDVPVPVVIHLTVGVTVVVFSNVASQTNHLKLMGRMCGWITFPVKGECVYPILIKAGKVAAL